MTNAEFTALVRYYTATNSTTLTDTVIKLLANVYIDDFAKEIIKADEDYFGAPQYTDLIYDEINSVPQREYPLPADILNQIKAVEAKLDGTNWIQLTEFDLTQYQRTTDEATIVATFSNASGGAFFDLYRGSLWLYTGTFADVVQGLKLWAFQWPAHITDLTLTTDLSVDPTNTSAGFPRTFHELLARRVSIAFKNSKDKQIKLSDNELKFDVDFQKAMDSITNANQKRPHTMQMPSESQYDDGYNL